MGAAACLAESDGRRVAYQSSINLLVAAGDEDGYHSEAEATRLLPDKGGASQPVIYRWRWVRAAIQPDKMQGNGKIKEL